VCWRGLAAAQEVAGQTQHDEGADEGAEQPAPVEDVGVADSQPEREDDVPLGFLSFFFLYLLRLLSVIDTPLKVGQERTDDDVSLFLLTEFMVHAQAAGTAAVVAPEDVETHAAELEEQLVEVEEEKAAELEADAARPDG
jgi:hypothetical protein